VLPVAATSTSVTADAGEIWLMELNGSVAEFKWK
jgi:hypothetical protein